MSVYVDKAQYPFGRMIMCHMLADTPAELRAMAKHIGVGLHWFQYKASTPHFDICKSKRALAINAGAIELERAEFVQVMQRIRKTWPRSDLLGVWLLPSVPIGTQPQE